MRFCRSRARTDSLTVAALKRAVRKQHHRSLQSRLRHSVAALKRSALKPNRLPHGRGSETATTSAEGRSGQIAESARPTAIPKETSKKRCMAICQPLVERGAVAAVARNTSAPLRSRLRNGHGAETVAALERSRLRSGYDTARKRRPGNNRLPHGRGSETVAALKRV